ncbi:MAG: spore coat protein [Candidatus Merdivicinus sp.]
MTARELAAVQDQLNLEGSLVRKYQMFAQTCVDPQLRTKCEEIAARHRNHYQSLLELFHES